MDYTVKSSGKPEVDENSEQSSILSVGETMAVYGGGSAVLEEDEADVGDDWDNSFKVDPVRAAEIRRDPEFIAWKADFYRSIAETEEDIKADRIYPMDEVVDKILRDIENGTL